MSKQELNDKEKPIITFEQYVQYQGLVEWPVTYEDHLEAFVHLFPYKNSEQIYEHFKEQNPFPTDITESFTKDFEKLWTRVQYHDSAMFHAHSKTPAGKAFSGEQLTPLVEEVQTVMKEQSENVSRTLDIKDYPFPGLSVVKAADIPGPASSSQILDRVSHAQDFKPGFLKVWKSFFTCGISVDVFKDTFWWVFLNKFKPGAEEEEALLDRIAAGFVALLMSVYSRLKDRLFEVYANCLAQAVYAAFCGAFPDSIDVLDDGFKRDLLDTIFYWVSGVKPTTVKPVSWRLSRLFDSADTGKDKEDESGDLELEFDELVANAQRGSEQPTSARAKSSSQANGDDASRYEEPQTCSPSSEVQRVCFRLGGHSPLVSRYLQLHSICTTARVHTPRTTRPRTTNLPPAQPAYHDIIRELEQRRKQRDQQYSQLCQQTQQEIAEIRQDARLSSLKLKRLQTEICGNATELRMTSQAIVEKWEHTTLYRQRQQRERSKSHTDERESTT